MDVDLRSEAEQYAKQALAESNREWYARVVAALDERDTEIERLRAAIDQARKLAWSSPVECERILTRAYEQKANDVP